MVDVGELVNCVAAQRAMSKVSQPFQKQRHLVHYESRCDVVELGPKLHLDVVRELLEALNLVSHFVKCFEVGAKCMFTLALQLLHHTVVHVCHRLITTALVITSA